MNELEFTQQIACLGLFLNEISESKSYRHVREPGTAVEGEEAAEETGP